MTAFVAIACNTLQKMKVDANGDSEADLKGKAEGEECAHTRRRRAAGASSLRGLEVKVEGAQRREERGKQEEEEGEECRETRAQGVCTRIIAESFCAFVVFLLYIYFFRDTTSATRL